MVDGRSQGQELDTLGGRGWADGPLGTFQWPSYEFDYLMLSQQPFRAFPPSECRRPE